MSKWSQIQNTFFDDVEKCYTIDAWLTDDPNEQGKVIAKVYEDGTKGTVYIDEDARTDEYAQAMIDDVIRVLE